MKKFMNIINIINIKNVLILVMNAILNRKKYETLSWWENFMGGHLTIGHLTIYGESAMHWAVNYKTRRWGYICFRLPFKCFGIWWPLYLYTSPDGTPQEATCYLGELDVQGSKAGRNLKTFILKELRKNKRTEGENIYKKLKYSFYPMICVLLPKKLIYTCFIDVMAHATTGIYSTTVIPELTGMEAIKRYEKDLL